MEDLIIVRNIEAPREMLDIDLDSAKRCYEGNKNSLFTQ
ncbi:MAG: hypothetical protein HW389_3693, partial [Bacteroidetes bacterium]|nr:hypothetical protein [Bacteroidota bacterium]